MTIQPNILLTPLSAYCTARFNVGRKWHHFFFYCLAVVALHLWVLLKTNCTTGYVLFTSACIYRLHETHNQMFSIGLAIVQTPEIPCIYPGSSSVGLVVLSTITLAHWDFFLYLAVIVLLELTSINKLSNGMKVGPGGWILHQLSFNFILILYSNYLIYWILPNYKNATLMDIS